MKWFYSQPVDILFESGAIEKLPEIIAEKNWKKGVLICDPFFVKNGFSEKVRQYASEYIEAIYSDITPNPRVEEVDACARVLRDIGADFAVSVGGGSSLDCAKAACAIAGTRKSVTAFHTGGEKLPGGGIPLIAVPTTAGTGSEVTCVAVLTNENEKVKAPIANPLLYPTLAIIDPKLTLSVPPRVTASTGLDVLSHALEGFWSKNHQPVCDALALHAARLVFENLLDTYKNGNNLTLREKMCEASVIAGLAFTLPKTAASHACSFPLTRIYGIPHGEACAFTLDSLCRINARAENGRLDRFANKLGFTDAAQMADRIKEMKEATGMRCTLSQAGIRQEDLPYLATQCHHPNMLNNPVILDDKMIIEMFQSLT